MNYLQKRLSVAAGAIVILLFFVVITFFHLFRSTTTVAGNKIAKDLKTLAAIFKRIDDSCGILGFDAQKNPINFLNVKSFVGSEVGSLNLKNPDKWEGPYLHDNPTMQGIEYMVIRTKQGYFITPGDGVELPNGAEIGKDFLLDEDADIPSLLHSQEGLLYKDKMLAIPLMANIPVDSNVQEEQEMLSNME